MGTELCTMPIFASGLQMDENKTNQTWLFNESGLEATNDAWRNRNAEDNWHCFDTSELKPRSSNLHLNLQANGAWVQWGSGHHVLHKLVTEHFNCTHVYIIKKLCCIYTSHEGAVCLLNVTDQPCYLITYLRCYIFIFLINQVVHIPKVMNICTWLHCISCWCC